MKFAYQEIDTYNALGMRWYKTPIGDMPSITTMLGHSTPADKRASLENWVANIGEKEAAIQTEEACRHGTAVHALAEEFLSGKPAADKPEIRQVDTGAFNSLKFKLRRISEVYGQEQAIYSPSLGIAGRFDCVGVYDGILCIIDFKTALRRLKNRDDIKDYELQLAFYARAHNELFGTAIENGVILMVCQGGIPVEFKVKITPELNAKLEARITDFFNMAIRS